MELRQLEYFVAVAEEAGFTRAARRVHISQSGVSAQIRQLELELGGALIDRSGRMATLTAAGAAALPHARAVLASASALRDAVDDVRGVVRGRLVVGMVTGCTIVPLFEALAAFHRAHPGIELALVEDASDRLLERVGTGAVDLALVGTAGPPARGVRSMTIVREPLIAAVPPAHPLAGRKRVSLGVLAKHPLVCMPRGTGIRAVFDEACARAGVQPSIALEASAPEAIAGLAVRGLGVAVLSASMGGAFEGRLRAVPLAGVRSLASLELVWRESAGPALDALLAYAHETFAERSSSTTAAAG